MKEGSPSTDEEEREARLYHEMLQKLTVSQRGPDTKLRDLLSHWLEAEQPPAAVRHETDVAVARFLATLGDMQVEQITEQTLRRFREKLQERPHQRTGQALDVRAITKSLAALRALLKWEWGRRGFIVAVMVGASSLLLQVLAWRLAAAFRAEDRRSPRHSDHA
jgi:hypothetical protein